MGYSLWVSSLSQLSGVVKLPDQPGQEAPLDAFTHSTWTVEQTNSRGYGSLLPAALFPRTVQL